MIWRFEEDDDQGIPDDIHNTVCSKLIELLIIR